MKGAWFAIEPLTLLRGHSHAFPCCVDSRYLVFEIASMLLSLLETCICFNRLFALPGETIGPLAKLGKNRLFSQ